MCLLMETKRATKIVFLLACLFSMPVLASPEDDQVAEFLRSNNMFSLLEAQLEDRIDHASEDERVLLLEELSGLYLKQLRSISKDDPYYELLGLQAQSLITRMGSRKMYELRIELFIDQYLAVEPQVELARLELLDLAERSEAIAKLKTLKSLLSNLVTQLDPEVAKIERAHSRSNLDSQRRDQEELPKLRRYRSLAHYYHAWTGYSLAMLNDQHVPADVYVSFGWLLGAEGKMPQYSVFNETTLEFEHVARAAIGLALAYAQSDDEILGRSWAKSVVYSEYLAESVQSAAMSRLLQIMAMDRAWTDLNHLVQVLTLDESSEDPYLGVADARFLALQSLAAMNASSAGQGGKLDAKRIAKHAVGALVAHGEIGHVLELYRRFDSFPVLANSFITTYAQALAELNAVESSGSSALYSSVALRFEDALESADAAQFPNERDDCALKLAYCELRSNRAHEAVKVCEELIERTTSDVIVEEARWLRVAALASLASKSTKDQANLDSAVREYIVAYPATPKSAKLILRHAMQGAVDTKIAIETLESIAGDDPIANSAKRALIGILYEHSKSIGYTDRDGLERIVELVRWVNEHDPLQSDETDVGRTQMGTTRIGLDILLRLPNPDIDFATQLIQYGQGLIKQGDSLAVYQSEFVYREVQVALLMGNFEDASVSIASLKTLDPKRSRNAQALMFQELMSVWRDEPSLKVAEWIIETGSVVLAMKSPPYPDPIGMQVSRMAETIAQAGHLVWKRQGDLTARDLAVRLSRLVLDRGRPSESGLIFTTQLASQAKNQELELQAWLMLLASYDAQDDRWYQARYESLRIMFDLDPARASSVYIQYKTLHPSGGPETWALKFQAFERLVRQPVPAQSGVQP